MNRKPGLAPDEHEQIQADLEWIHRRLVSITVAIRNAYPKSSPAGNRVSGACRLVKIARVMLDAQAITHKYGINLGDTNDTV